MQQPIDVIAAILTPSSSPRSWTLKFVAVAHAKSLKPKAKEAQGNRGVLHALEQRFQSSIAAMLVDTQGDSLKGESGWGGSRMYSNPHRNTRAICNGGCDT